MQDSYHEWSPCIFGIPGPRMPAWLREKYEIIDTGDSRYCSNPNARNLWIDPLKELAWQIEREMGTEARRRFEAEHLKRREGLKQRIDDYVKSLDPGTLEEWRSYVSLISDPDGIPLEGTGETIQRLAQSKQRGIVHLETCKGCHYRI